MDLRSSGACLKLDCCISPWAYPFPSAVDFKRRPCFCCHHSLFAVRLSQNKHPINRSYFQAKRVRRLKRLHRKMMKTRWSLFHWWKRTVMKVFEDFGPWYGLFVFFKGVFTLRSDRYKNVYFHECSSRPPVALSFRVEPSTLLVCSITPCATIQSLSEPFVSSRDYICATHDRKLSPFMTNRISSQWLRIPLHHSSKRTQNYTQHRQKKLKISFQQTLKIY